MSFNIFDFAKKSDITVGYVDPSLGYVTGVSISDANEYARKNPGTTFIFETRDGIRYLSINEVNQLTPKDLASSADTCKGIEVEGEPDPPSVIISGCGGVGAVGNPVFGRDGCLLAVDLISGGFGYQCPPLIEVRDDTGLGVGAVTRAILVGDPDYSDCKFADTFEVFDQEDDFEEYQIDPVDDEGYGTRYDANGKAIGKWDPYLYANLSKDPITKEIQKYQDFLQKLSTPWWSTRIENQLRVTTGNKTTKIKYNVQNPGWGDSDSFMNKYAISPVPPSNAPGSNFAGDEFTLEWEENFPYTGEYVFRAQADNVGRYYLDNEKLIETTRFKQDQTPKVVKKTVKQGVHRIRVDLYNVPILQNSSTQIRKTFNTVDYIDKADRRLWRIDPRVGRDAEFINQYGVIPFDPNSDRAQEESLAGTHVIRWESVEFPTDGNYNIEIMVDDNVTLYIGNRDGGEEKEIRKTGFSDSSRSTGKSVETRYFKAGNYRIRAELEQIKDKSLSNGNPTALAINIQKTTNEQPVISAKSWNDNPMGVALTIDAPMPPIPQEPIPQQEGRCPNNPIWTTRFPGGKEKWWPVKFDDRWSSFMNRYAISPIPPLSKPGSDGSGIVYRNFWNVDIPYDGFYGLKGTVDNGGRILIDGKEISNKGSGGLGGFSNNNPQSKKFFLTKGTHSIEVEVESQKTNTLQRIDKKIFSTKDWLSGKSKAEYTYDGPTSIANYKGDFISPVFQNVNVFPNEEIQGKTWIFRWTNVDFPVDGQYTLESEGDDELVIKVDGIRVGTSKVSEGRRKTSFDATKGKKTVELELSNARIPDTGFEKNPTLCYAQITVPIDVSTEVGQSWSTNPVGISAILIPPPCPKKITGRGSVCRVIVDDPGNGFPITQGPGYPATLRLRSVEVENPGINYNCGIDKIQISPSNGAVLDYECDTFGRIVKVKVLNPGLGFTRYPEITVPSDTGVNVAFRPQFEIVRDPIVVDPEIIIQVTDLVGLKQTGYVDGRPYYGAVFYKDGVRYAGFYQTPGDLVQIYDTLQESIDGVVVTRPSAIQRQGTDIASNNSRLNIPGAPDEVI